MKLVLQIALGVFLGSLTAQLVFEQWRFHQTSIAQAKNEQARLEQEKSRQQFNERIRSLFLKNKQTN
jgi:hypothetical protein